MLKSILMLCWAVTGALLAQETPRIAVIDLTAAFKAHPETVKAEAQLLKKRLEAREQFNGKANQLKELLQKHQEVTTQLIEAGPKASAEKKSEARELLSRSTELEREVAEMRTTQERDLEQGFVEERWRILELITVAIKKFNQDKGYDLVLDLSAASSNGLPQVLDAPGADDITQPVVEMLRKQQ